MKTFRIFALLFILIGATGYCFAADSNSVPSFKELRKHRNPQADLKLVEAIKKLDVDGVRNALGAGANPNFRREGEHWVSSPIYLLLQTLYVREVPGTGITDSNMQKYLAILQLLFDAGEKEQRSDCNVLTNAAYRDLSSIIEVLLKNGFNPNQHCGKGLTPIEIAEQQMYRDTIYVFHRHGVAPVPKETAAHLRFIRYARDCDVVGMAKNLWTNDFVNRPDKDGKTALTEAVSCSVTDGNWYATVSYLLQKRANPNLQTTYGDCESALHIAMRSTQVFSKHENAEVYEIFGLLGIEALLKAGADVSSHNEDGQTPLHIAAEYDNLKGAILLIEREAKVMEKDNLGRTPLDYAKSTMMTKLLKSHSAKEQ